MRTVRAQLTLAYAVALAGTMFVFAGTLLFFQAPDPFAEIDARTKPQADLIANMVAEVSLSGGVVETDSLTGRSRLSFRVVELIQSVDDYILMFDSTGHVLYAAIASARLTQGGFDSPQGGVPTDSPVVLPEVVITGAADSAGGAPVGPDALRDLGGLSNLSGPAGTFGNYDLGGSIGGIRYYARPVSAGRGIASLMIAVPNAEVVRVGRRILLGMLASAPLILVASTLVGYLIAGRTLAPMDRIIDEIEAITDGRSLHRRVLDVRSTEELQRLSTTLNNMLVRLERNFLSLRRFTADASHELKTPLTVLRAGVERAITHPEATPELLAVLEEALIEVNRMTELVDSLLTLARADEGRAPVHLERLDIRELLGELTETASILGEQAHVNVRVAMPARPLVVAVDRRRSRQLFMNLLTNAVKYTPAGGTVTIECRRRGGEIVFEIRDTGIGIASGELPHVFDRFWRADVARSRSGQRPGAGLGLAICKWIAEAHGGSIRVESRRGKGTTFTVVLPVGDPDALRN